MRQRQLARFAHGEDHRRRTGKGVRFINTYGLGVTHPELGGYATEINKIVNQSH